MSSDRKKEKRKARAKAKKIGKRKKSFIPSGFTEVMRMSVCPTHGPYFPPEKLCPCYDADGVLPSGQTYQESYEQAMSGDVEVQVFSPDNDDRG